MFTFQVSLAIIVVLLACALGIVSGAAHDAAIAPNANVKQNLKDTECHDTGHSPDWWVYIWCSGSSVRQIHFDHTLKSIESNNLIGYYRADESSESHEIYRNTEQNCYDDKNLRFQLVNN